LNFPANHAVINQLSGTTLDTSGPWWGRSKLQKRPSKLTGCLARFRWPSWKIHGLDPSNGPRATVPVLLSPVPPALLSSSPVYLLCQQISNDEASTFFPSTGPQNVPTRHRVRMFMPAGIVAFPSGREPPNQGHSLASVALRVDLVMLVQTRSRANGRTNPFVGGLVPAGSEQ